jgi:uncharacterized HAD superfamily protein
MNRQIENLKFQSKINPNYCFGKTEIKVKIRQRTKKICVDLDGTLLTDMFHRLNDESLVVSYSLEDLQSLCKNAIPYFKAISVMWKLIKYFKIIIVSGRNKKLREITETWLKRWNIPYDKLILMKKHYTTLNNYYDYKLRMFQRFNPSMIIEDSLGLIKFAFSFGFNTFLIKNEDSWNEFRYNFMFDLIMNYNI